MANTEDLLKRLQDTLAENSKLTREFYALASENQNLKNQLICADYIPKSAVRYALENDPVDSVILCVSDAKTLFFEQFKKD